jgi:hypothetical protein
VDNDLLAVDIGTVAPVSAFPPAGLFELADGSAGDIVFVVPVRSASQDWGVLAAVSRIQDTTPPGPRDDEPLRRAARRRPRPRHDAAVSVPDDLIPLAGRRPADPFAGRARRVRRRRRKCSRTP